MKGCCSPYVCVWHYACDAIALPDRMYTRRLEGRLRNKSLLPQQLLTGGSKITGIKLLLSTLMENGSNSGELPRVQPQSFLGWIIVGTCEILGTFYIKRDTLSENWWCPIISDLLYMSSQEKESILSIFVLPAIIQSETTCIVGNFTSIAIAIR